MSQTLHFSVLLEESVDALVHDTNGLYIDGTFGRGGHSREILSRLSSDGRLLAFDKDDAAVQAAQALIDTDSRFEIAHASFASMQEVLAQKQLKADGILLDLGVSSPQLDEAERGFSFMRDGPLDMRMDTSKGISAQQWIAETEAYDMVRVFRLYGEEKFAKRIARKIVEEREQGEISRTGQLADIIESAVPKRHGEKKHPATRVFQAIRIEVNNELDDLHKALDAAMESLRVGGRLVVISFHSLEDRIVKRFFKKYSQSQDFPIGVPVTHDQLKAPLKLLSKAVKAGDEELTQNIRSRSAVMRVAQRCE